MKKLVLDKEEKKLFEKQRRDSELVGLQNGEEGYGLYEATKADLLGIDVQTLHDATSWVPGDLLAIELRKHSIFTRTKFRGLYTGISVIGNRTFMVILERRGRKLRPHRISMADIRVVSTRGFDRSKRTKWNRAMIHDGDVADKASKEEEKSNVLFA